MTRLLGPLAAAVAGAGLACAAGSAAQAAALHAAPPPPPPITVEEVTTPDKGEVVADLNGMTLYKYDAEARGRIVCVADCLNTWIPLAHPHGAKLYLPSGWEATLGFVRRPEGTEQITFDGFPVYRYVGDQQPGDTNGDVSAIDPLTPWHVVPAPPVD